MRPKILIIGSRGYIGSSIKQGLTQCGHSVYGTVCSHIPSSDEYKVDVRLPGDFNQLPKDNFDIIINASGSVDNTLSRQDIYSINALGVKNIVDWLSKTNCRHFIHISSTGVYGINSMGQHRNEQSKNLLSRIGVPYQRSKAKAESIIANISTPYTILRMPAVLGIGDSFITPVICSSLINSSFFQCGDEKNRISIIVKDSLPHMIENIIGNDAENETFNSASHHIPWTTLVTEYASSLNCNLPETGKSILTIPFKLQDMHYLFLLTHSRFGAHFPTDKFERKYNVEHKFSWKEIVSHAAKHYKNKND